MAKQEDQKIKVVWLYREWSEVYGCQKMEEETTRQTL